jgi:hypothetical protein
MRYGSPLLAPPPTATGRGYRHPLRRTRRALPPSTASVSSRETPRDSSSSRIRGSWAALLQSSGGSVKPSKSVPIATCCQDPPLHPRTVSIVLQIASRPGTGCALSSQNGMKITPTPRPVFIIWTRNGVDTEALNPVYYEAAGAPKTLWEIPESKHIGGLQARPREYERRVVGFFDDALLR